MADRKGGHREAAGGFVDVLVTINEWLGDYLVVRTYDEAGGGMSGSFEGRLDGIRVKPAANELRLYFDLGLGKTRLRLGKLTGVRLKPPGADVLEFWRGGRRAMELAPCARRGVNRG
jgi:hypothetical protein